ncbi:hypothetical protein DV737_g925, partial [Chaetothyriales sp. CBS 132003]
MATYAEDRVLRPLDPVPEDVNEWPDFALREVKVFYQGKGRYADLLEASADTPICVLGELMPLDDEVEHLALIDNPVYARIKIDNVISYSFGQNDDGKPILWAAGKAGWYEISPSDRYLSHYNDTAEAIDLFYFMVDQHQKLPKKRQSTGFRVDPFLKDYQKHTGYRINDDDEAMETIHKHHRFLLKQMIEERESIDWSKTHLWKHLAEAYSEEVEQLQTALAQANAAVKQPRPGVEVAKPNEDSDESNDNEESQEDSSDSGTSPAKSSSGQSESSAASSEEGDEEDPMSSTDWTRSIWELLNTLRKTPTFNIRECGIDALANELVKLSSFGRDHKAAVRAIERSAGPLLKLMNEAKLRKKFNWSTRAIYDELEATLADEVAEEILKTPAAKRARKPHRMKSVLRPSGAGKGRKRTKGTNDSQDEDEQMIDPPITSPAARANPGRHAQLASRARESTVDSAYSREDSPSRQLNGYHDPTRLPSLPPGPEAQEMLDLVNTEAKRVGRQHQTSHLQMFLEHMIVD